MKTDAKQMIVLAVSFVIGLAAFGLTHLYLSGERNRMEQERAREKASMQMVRVVVADRDLPSGTILQKSDRAIRSVPRLGLSGDPVLEADAAKIVGKKLLATYDSGSPILWRDVDTPYRPRSGLSSMIGEKMRAISIPVGGVSAVSGLVQPYDRVDILGTFSIPSANSGESETVTMTILENVTVLAVGTYLAKSQYGGDTPRRSEIGGYSMVSVEASPEEAELLVFASYMKGRLTLSLRNPEDMSMIDKLESVDFSHLRDKIPEYRQKRQDRLLKLRFSSPR